MVARDLRAENPILADNPAGYELVEEENIKRILRAMEISPKSQNDFAKCQRTYMAKVSKSLPKVHLVGVSRVSHSLHELGFTLVLLALVCVPARTSCVQ